MHGGRCSGRLEDRCLIETLNGSSETPTYQLQLTTSGDLTLVSGLNVARGQPLFCDVTILSSHSRNGQARGGTSNQGGRLLEDANDQNNVNYSEVADTGLGSLYSLGSEVYGRWSASCVSLVPSLAREHSRGLHPRIRRGAALGFQNRWWGILSIALQKSVAQAVRRDTGEDIATVGLEPCPRLADLPVLA